MQKMDLMLSKAIATLKMKNKHVRTPILVCLLKISMLMLFFVLVSCEGKQTQKKVRGQQMLIVGFFKGHSKMH
jgi:hypothetical protein